MLDQLRAALPRILALLVLVFAGTAAVAATVGALAGRGIAHSLATVPMTKNVTGFKIDPLGHFNFANVDIAQ